MEDLDDHHHHHHDDIWVESDTYQQDNVYESKKRKGSRKHRSIRIVIILFVILLALFLGWLKSFL
jgi:hypothetical protein